MTEQGSHTSTHTLHVTGMHCTACTIRITDTLTEHGMSDVQVSLGNETVTCTLKTHEDTAVLAQRCNELLQRDGYTFFAERPKRQSVLHEWLVVFGVLAALAGVAFLTGTFEVTSILAGRDMSLGTAFLIGLVASVSTCLAVVGGLVLTLSATYAQEGASLRPQVLFHAGRMIGFFVLGGLLGVVGTVLQIGLYGSAILGVVVSVVMLVLGVHLLELTPKVRAFTLSRGAFDRVSRAVSRTGTVTPFLIGAATFFLPCGFTQSMQVVALSTGNFLDGALTMLSFAGGTLPVLALVSFGSLDLAQSRFRGIFFKTAGVLVILFAVYNAYTALLVLGIIH